MLFERDLFSKAVLTNANDLQNEFLNNDGTSKKAMIHDDKTNLEKLGYKREIDTPVSLSDDVIELNIGGQKMTTLRSTLTVVPNSKLARMFSKNNNGKNLLVDKHGVVFFDYNPIHFNYLLDQLRAIKQLPRQPAHQLQFQAPYARSPLNFTHMLVELGLTGM